MSDYCGDNKHNIFLENVGDVQNIRINGLPDGQVCVYKVIAKCGDPQVKVDPVAGV